MCPMCLATMAWIATGATSTGGISALVIKRFRTTNTERTNKKRNLEQGGRYGHKQGDSDEYEDATDRIAAGVGRCAPATTSEGEGVDARP